MRVIESEYWTLNSLGIYCMRFANYAERCRNATDAGLVYVMKDARAAMLANPDGVKAGYYADEINYCADELARRDRGGRRKMPTAEQIAMTSAALDIWQRLDD